QLDVAFEVREGGDTDRPILVVDDDPGTGQSIAQQLLPFGFAVHCLQDLDEFETVLEQIEPAAVVVDIMHPQGPLAGPVKLAELRKRVELSVPVIFVSARGDLEARLNACRAGGTAFFTKPLDFAALAETLEQATGRRAERRLEILIIDDDSRLAWSYAEILNRAGMSAMVLTDPMRTLEQLEKNQPDLILLDLYMPHCSGQELAAALRQHASYLSIPIVFLSSESDLDQQILALGLGGDEFLTKPIHPSRLVATVLPRARRGRLLGTLLVRDGLTGLFNHTRLKDRLEREILRALRDDSPLVLVMIDLDRFKEINDTFGHTVGDRVLCSLAAILRRRLRRTDTIARYGGDEFAVILPSTPTESAAAIMREISESFEALELRVGAEAVGATLSWGLAELGSLRSTGDLIEAADQALYRAKGERRD
ncbi:MAG: diguanylate cyclase, partial [Acidobacteriota bacterium]